MSGNNVRDTGRSINGCKGCRVTRGEIVISDDCNMQMSEREWRNIGSRQRLGIVMNDSIL